MEGYEGVAALVRGWPPQTPPVRQGHTPETRIGCAGGGWGMWEGVAGWRDRRGGTLMCVTILLYLISQECR